MRNIYQERMIRKSCKSQDEWDDYCDYVYHEIKEENIDMKDIVVDVISNSSTNVKMSITHVPTGISVSGEGAFQFRLRNSLIKQLSVKLEFV